MLIVQNIFNNVQYVRMEESMFLGKSNDFWYSNLRFSCNVDREKVAEFVWFEDIGQNSANDWVNQHNACDRDYVLATVDNRQNERMETLSRNRLEDEQIQLLKNILETNPNL